MKKNILAIALATLLISCNINNDDSLLTSISYKEYIEIINNENETSKDIFVFTSSSCPHCQKIEPLINKYISQNTDENIKIYKLSLDYKTTLGGKYIFKDSSMGYYSGNIENDCIKALDNRITSFLVATSQLLSEEIITNTDPSYYYSYIYTPLIIFYQNKLEKKIINNAEKLIETNEDGSLSYESFLKMFCYPTNDVLFDKEFNLSYYKEEN